MAIVQAGGINQKHVQADGRHTEWFEDQWGRAYFATVGPKGDPDESPKPSGWTAPLNPEWAKHLLLPPESYRTVSRVRGRQTRIVINMDAWLVSAEEAEENYRRWKEGVVDKLSGGIDVQRLLENPPAAIARQFGNAPFPGVLWVQMIADGDPWALGKTEAIPEWAVPLLPALRIGARAAHLLSAAAMREIAAEERRTTVARHATVMDHIASTRGTLAQAMAEPLRDPVAIAGVPILRRTVLEAMGKETIVAYATAAGVTLIDGTKAQLIAQLMAVWEPPTDEIPPTT